MTNPLCSSSAAPMMECSGVFSSCETLAVNSRLSRSDRSFSVTSTASSTVPRLPSSATTGLAVSMYSRSPLVI